MTPETPGGHYKGEYLRYGSVGTSDSGARGLNQRSLWAANFTRTPSHGELPQTPEGHTNAWVPSNVFKWPVKYLHI